MSGEITGVRGNQIPKKKCILHKLRINIMKLYNRWTLQVCFVGLMEQETVYK